MQKESIDLMNIEYEDVLQLYRGWRKSESALKDKTSELSKLKDRIKQLQDSHQKFRNQIQSLDSVKDLTITLQNKLAILQQDNLQLSEENKELAQLNIQAEELIKEKELDEDKQFKLLRDTQLDLATWKGKYEETLRNQKELEKLVIEEQSLRLASDTRSRDAEHATHLLKEENKSLRDKADKSSIRLNQSDQEILHASEQLASLSREVSVMHEARHELSTKDAEVGLLKGDIARLLRLLEISPATKDFLAHWHDCGGMDFVGIDKDLSGVSRVSISNLQLLEETGLLADMSLDINNRGYNYGPNRSIHANNNNSILTSFDLSPAEFAHLKRIHGGDPFPMTSNLLEEAEYWVPSDAAKLGLQFLTAKIPHASPKVIMDFLRSMNKIWLKREMRKVKRIKQILGSTIDDLKRQLAHSKPYKGVIAEKQIRRLSKQIKTERKKKLIGRPRDSLESISYSGNIHSERFDITDRLEDNNNSSSLLHDKRLCHAVNRVKKSNTTDVNAVSTEKLLEASLNSLESIGRQMTVAGNHNINMSNKMNNNTTIDSLLLYDYHPNDDQHSSSINHQSISTKYPNESYLRGAMWLGRNFTIVTEELAEAMDNFRSKFISEVSNASEDMDLRRCCHRLTLLANSGITQAYSLVDKSRSRTREILQGAAALNPGDSRAFKALLRTLPIESALSSNTFTSTTSISNNNRHHDNHIYNNNDNQRSLFNQSINSLNRSKESSFFY